MARPGASIVVRRVLCEYHPDGTNWQIEAKLILGAAAEQIQQEKVLKVARIVMLAIMSLCPRYSLLTLLILTAFVAGGVKLWYGPHHVVERPAANVEREYTYTRDWRGNKIIDGPHVERIFEQGKLASGEITWYRQGEQVQLWVYQILVIPVDFPDQKIEPIPKDDQGNPYITPEERARLLEIVDCEKLQPLPPGRKFSVRELLFYPSVSF